MQKNQNRQGYKKTKVGWIPEEWHCTRLGEVFEKRNARGTDGVPVFSVSQEHGLVPRDSLDRRVETNLSSRESLLVEPGDIAYNTMRMWQGAVDVCRETCVVSPAYVVCRPLRKRVSSNFMLLYFKLPIGLHRLWSYSYDVVDDRLRLYFKDFALVPAPLPSLPEQEAIAEVLECWDKAIRGYDRKIEQKRNIKKGLMQWLLSGKQRLPGFDGKWEKVRLGKIVEMRKDKFDPTVNPARPCVELEHIPSESGRIARTVSSSSLESTKNVFSNGDVLFGKLRPNLKKYAFPDFDGVCSSEIWVLRPKSECLASAYLFWLVQTHVFTSSASATCGSKMPRADWAHVSSVEVAIPASAPEQAAIAAVLSSADSEISALERKLWVLREQKRFLLNNMVTGTIRLPQFASAGAANVTTGATA